MPGDLRRRVRSLRVIAGKPGSEYFAAQRQLRSIELRELVFRVIGGEARTEPKAKAAALMTAALVSAVIDCANLLLATSDTILTRVDLFKILYQALNDFTAATRNVLPRIAKYK